MTTNLSQAQKLMSLSIINCTFYVMYVMGTYLQKRDTNIEAITPGNYKIM
jgi:hypothetical protein